MLLDNALRVDPQIKNVVNLVRHRARCQPERIVYTFLADGETEADRLTYQDLDQSARAIAAQLQQTVSSGDRVLLLYPPGLDFITAFFGCLYASVIAVPAYPPRQNQSISRLESITANAQAARALTTTSLLHSLTQQFSTHPILQPLPILATDDIPAALADSWQDTQIEPDAIAFLQYTSGSTGTPKGVMVSHRNLLHNSELIHQRFETTADTVSVSWLPAYHDMGLIGSILQPLYADGSMVLMSPLAFLQKPDRWLNAISRYQATVSGGPNFAYDLCVQKIRPEQLEGVDLSGWEVAFNGAEPVRAETLERFAAKFAPYGFRRESFYPCYGMAETTLLISGGIKAHPPTVCTLDSAALALNRVILSTDQPQGTTQIVAQGQTGLGQKIAIANPHTLTHCQNDEVGEIWVAGASIAQGYWQREEETQATFQAHLADTGAGPFLRTGDLGFLQNGELFVTGRLKDLIIVRGRNYYPQDIEWTVQASHPALRSGCGAVFAIEKNHQECLIVAQEIERTALRTLDPADVIRTIRAAVSQVHELSVYGVWLLKPASIPKTSSGKISRSACRHAFQTGSLDGMIAQDLLPEMVEEAAEPALSSEPKLTVESLLAITPPNRQSYLEAYIQEQLAKGLRVDPAKLTPQQPLHKLGLDSLATLEIKHQIEVELGVDVPIVKFLEGITIADLAMQILSQMNGDTNKQPSTKPSFFCVHPVLGVASAYYDLAEALGQDQPFYGLQSPAILGEVPPKDRIEAIAAEYIQGIRQIQPEGPYFIGGWSFGSFVAFEMAQQLQQGGQSVAFLGLIDTPAPSTNRIQHFVQTLRFIFNSVLRNLGPYLGIIADTLITTTEERQLFQHAGEKANGKAQILIDSDSIAKIFTKEARLAKLFHPAIRRINQVSNAHNRAMFRYKPEIYSGKVTLFRASQQSGKTAKDPTMGWNALATGGVEMHTVQGNHLNVLLQPQVEGLAKVLKACLDQAIQETTGTHSTG